MPKLTLCFDAHRSDGKVRRWHSATHVALRGVTLETVYKGLHARQPRAYLRGIGTVTWMGSQARIEP